MRIGYFNAINFPAADFKNPAKSYQGHIFIQYNHFFGVDLKKGGEFPIQ